MVEFARRRPQKVLVKSVGKKDSNPIIRGKRRLNFNINSFIVKLNTYKILWCTEWVHYLQNSFSFIIKCFAKNFITCLHLHLKTTTKLICVRNFISLIYDSRGRWGTYLWNNFRRWCGWYDISVTGIFHFIIQQNKDQT